MKESLDEQVKDNLAEKADEKPSRLKPKGKRRLSDYRFENIDIKRSKSSTRSGSHSLAELHFFKSFQK